jgi:hypothetical protein
MERLLLIATWKSALFTDNVPGLMFSSAALAGIKQSYIGST